MRTIGETTDKLKGKVKQIMGRATKNRRLVAEGVALQARGAARGVVKPAKRPWKRSSR